MERYLLIMGYQSVFNKMSSLFDVKVDFSEIYDYELYNVNDSLDFGDGQITSILNSTCITGSTLDNIKPWIIPIGENYVQYSCQSLIKSRTNKGWTSEFVFNRDNIDWSGGTTFYYWGISGETEQEYFADNNLSFSFTDDGRIKWESYHYSGNCDSTSGYTESYYTSTGQTVVLCEDGTSSDFLITIVFDRNNYFDEICEIENKGGKNDMIIAPYTIEYTGATGTTTTQITTGYSITNDIYNYITGQTVTTNYVEKLNKKWFTNRHLRLGTLSIYLNGNRIYKLKNWEEIVPTERGSENNLVQSWGGGTTGYLNIHTGQTQFTLLHINYIEQPLNVLEVKNRYLTNYKSSYDINECNTICVEDVFNNNSGHLLEHSLGILLTQDDSHLLYRT